MQEVGRAPWSPSGRPVGLGDELGRHAGPCGLMYAKSWDFCEVGHSAHGLPRQEPALPGDLTDLETN